MSTLVNPPYIPKGSTELTPRQEEALTFIRHYLRQNGLPPTTREIAEAIGCNSTNSARAHIEALRRKGALRRMGPSLSRGFVPAVPEGHCPCCGRPFDDVK